MSETLESAAPARRFVIVAQPYVPDAAEVPAYLPTHLQDGLRRQVAWSAHHPQAPEFTAAQGPTPEVAARRCAQATLKWLAMNRPGAHDQANFDPLAGPILFALEVHDGKQG